MIGSVGTRLAVVTIGCAAPVRHPLVNLEVIVSFKRFVAAFVGGLAISGAAAASVVYSYDVGNFGFTYTSPSLYPQFIPAANLDRCDFGIGITCTSVSIYDNYYSVQAHDAAAADPSEVFSILNVQGCPPYFAVGQVVPTSSCQVSMSDEKYRPLSLGSLTVADAATVPEPGSLALAALAGWALVWSRRRSRSGV